MKFRNILFGAITLTSFSAEAADYGFFFKPYVGADYDYVHANYKDGGDQIAEDNLNGADVHVGARVHKYLGFEGGYLWTGNGNKSNVLGSGINTSVNVRGFTFDALGYLPVIDKFELIGTAGVSRLRADLNVSGLIAGSGHEYETKGRVGGGAQYWLTDNLNVRGIVRYQGANFSGALDNAVIASLGLNWQF